jgi:glucokinase
MVIDTDGPPCPCGGTGHIESYVARPALAAAGREAAATFAGAELKRRAGDSIDQITAEIVLEAAEAGDEVAIGIVEKAAEKLGRALVGMVNLLNPSLIVLGGGIGEASDVFRVRAAAAIEREALAGRRDVRLIAAQLGNDAGALGAAALAFDEYESRETLHR